MKKAVILSFLFFIIMGVAFSMENNKKEEKEVKNWLVAGPVDIVAPPFLDTYMRSDYIKDLLEKNIVKIGRFSPEEGKVLSKNGNGNIVWEKLTNKINFPENPDDYSIYYFSTYIRVNRFTKLTLNFKINKPFKVYLDGKDVLTVNNPSNDGSEKEVDLIEGTHWILVKVVSDFKFIFNVTYKKSEETKESDVEFTTSPERTLSKYEILNGKSVKDLSISDDGHYVVYKVSRKDLEGKEHSYFEIWDAFKKDIVFKSPEDVNISKILWVPKKKGFLFSVKDKGKTAIFFFDVNTHNTKILLGPMKDLSLSGVSPDGKFFLYSLFYRVKDYEKGYKFFKSLEDRQMGSRNKTTVYIYYFNSGKTFPLLFKQGKIYLRDVSLDGKKFLLSKEVINYKKRPYVYSAFYIFNLNTKKVEKILSDPWVIDASLSPDGTKLAVMGGPSAFNKLGYNLKKKNLIPNDYDNQLYIYDIKTKKAICVSKDFYPSLISQNWVKNNLILLKVNDTVYDNLYMFNPVKNVFKKVKTKVDVVRNFDISRDGKYIVYSGVKMQAPESIYLCDLTENKNFMVDNLNENLLKGVKLGRVENFSFIDKDGYQIVGRIYYPPYFNPNKKYPAIVYYYGGTLPIERDFGGRYPKNWWAAKGYVVYVLQPRGTVGFGQEFSAFHVNDWGTKAGEDIIEGTKKFLEKHPFVNPKKVGILGASYGGFMTMSLVTKTNMFRAAISHAGISTLTHYWGEGYWGYTYSAIATAKSFPWNRKDIYVGKSPIYNANKIKTPLLLLQGTADTNVPTGESDIMFTALKLLGVPTALVKFKDENHWILGYKHRIKWMDTIVAWFDKWLKDEPQMWESMYPEK